VKGIGDADYLISKVADVLAAQQKIIIPLPPSKGDSICRCFVSGINVVERLSLAVPDSTTPSPPYLRGISPVTIFKA
jgi:hypothetical protein